LKPKKKILLFIDWYLPGFKAGGPITSCANLVGHLSNHYDFYIVTRNTDYCETEPYEFIRSDVWNNQKDGSSVYYVSDTNLNFSFFKKLVKSTEFDVMYVNGIYSKYFSIYPLLISKSMGKHVLVSARGMLASSAIGVKFYKKRLFLFLASLLKLYRGIEFHATNEKEKQDIYNLVGKNAKVKIAPNLHKVNLNCPTSSTEKVKGVISLISIARISPEKNLYQLLEILMKQTANITLDIYGTLYDLKYWHECQVLISKMPNNIKISYRGTIHPNSIEETIKKYHFLTLLSFGENFGHVVLESFMAARPVIISDQTPWKNLNEKVLGWDLDLKRNDEINNAIGEAAQMDQKDFDKYVESSIKFAKSIIEDETIVKQSVDLFGDYGD